MGLQQLEQTRTATNATPPKKTYEEIRILILMRSQAPKSLLCKFFSDQLKYMGR